MINELDNHRQFVEWQIFDELEPSAAEQANYNAAHIVQTLWHIARDAKKYPNGWPLGDFVLAFGDAISTVAPSRKQTIEEQERIIDAWIMGSNAFFNAKAARDAAIAAEKEAATRER